MVKFEITSRMLDTFKGDGRSITIAEWIKDIGATRIEWAGYIDSCDMICFEDEEAALVFRLKAGV